MTSFKKTESLFNQPVLDLDSIDMRCQQYFIDILIFKDTDPVWKFIPTIERIRPPIYKNNNYGLFACGNYAKP